MKYYNEKLDEYSYTTDLYSIKSNIYTHDDNACIIYPYINIYNDFDKQKLINKIIYEYLFTLNNGELNEFISYDKNTSKKNLNNVNVFLDFEIFYNDDNIIAFLFKGIYRDKDNLNEVNILVEKIV